MTKQPCVYIMAGKKNGTLYLGVTGNLVQRIWKREWKINLIEKDNEDRLDLWSRIQ